MKKIQLITKATYIYSLLVIPAILLLSSMETNQLSSVGIVILIHLILLLVNFLYVFIKQIIYMIKREKYIKFIHILISLLLLAMFGSLYVVVFIGAIAFILPFL